MSDTKQNEMVPELSSMTLLAWSVYSPSDTVRGDMAEVTTTADKERCGLILELFKAKDVDGKTIKCESWAKIKSTYNEMRTELNKISQPLYVMTKGGKRLRRGVRLIRLLAVSKVEEIVNEYEKKGNASVEEFLKVYPSLVDLARQTMGAQFKETDYPTPEQLRSKFGVGWSYLPFGTPANLPKDVLEREIKAQTDAMRETLEQSRYALRAGLLNLVEHLTKALAPAEDGKRKRFDGSNLQKIIEFSDLLKYTDMTNDSELSDIAMKARNLIENATAKDVKGDLRDTVIKGMNAIGAELKGMVETVGGRRFNFDEAD